MSSKATTPTPDAPIADLDKEVVHLPDGRELTYYRFPGGTRTDPAPPPAPEKER